MLLETSAGRWLERLKWYWPALLALLVMLPRLASPQFGLLDDGVTVITSRALLEQPGRLVSSGGDAGRFRWMYNVYHAAVYAVAGERPAVFFLANALIAAGIVVQLGCWLRRCGRSAAEAWIASAIFLIAPPTVESFYTLSKGEPLQLLLILAAGSLLLGHSSENSRAGQGVRVTLAACAILGAVLSKETGVVFLPIALGWWVAATFYRLRRPSYEMAGGYGKLALAATVATVIFFALWALFGRAGVLRGAYVQQYSLSPQRLRGSAAACAALMLHDFPQLVALVPLLLIGVVRGSLVLPFILVEALIWIAGWTLVLLPWLPPLSYQLLPVAAGVAVLSAVGIWELAQQARERGTWWSRAGLPVCVALCLCSGVNGYTAARVQLLLDDVNARLVDRLARLPQAARLGVALPAFNEYVVEIRLHLEAFKRRRDVTVGSVALEGGQQQEAVQHWDYLAEPHMAGQLAPCVRSAVNEADVQARKRRLEPLLAGRAELLWREWREIQALDIGLHSGLCWLLAEAGGMHCRIPRPVVVARPLVYGWTLYRLPARS